MRAGGRGCKATSDRFGGDICVARLTAQRFSYAKRSKEDPMTQARNPAHDGEAIARLKDRLGARSIVLVGLMGAGKTTVGRLVAQQLGLEFVDADHEIEHVSRMSVPELFEAYGEAEFRELEKRVIGRILLNGPQVLATGGGAYMNAETREAIAAMGVAVWLSADLDLLMDRVSRKQHRPLLKTADPRATMQELMKRRYPVYALADVTVQSRDERKDVIADEVVAGVDALMASQQPELNRTAG
jgi:shikimate kinase